MYLASLRVADGGFVSEFYPDVLLDRDAFPPLSPLVELGVPAGSFVFGESSLVDPAFSGACEDYFVRVVQQQLLAVLRSPR